MRRKLTRILPKRPDFALYFELQLWPGNALLFGVNLIPVSINLMTSHSGAPRRPTLLVILDGFGLNPDPTHNAIARAQTPNFDRYFSSYPMTSLEASGRGVGLPAGQMGNSEVGHMTIGCGSIVKQDLVRIDDAIEDGSFNENPALLGAVQRARAAGRPLHLIGLVSDGGVHSHIDHLAALIRPSCT